MAGCFGLHNEPSDTRAESFLKCI